MERSWRRVCGPSLVGVLTVVARHPILTDEEVLARARSVFVERGYGARTKQIAAAVGLTWGAIALRFGDKRTLFSHAMDVPVCSATDLECQETGTAELPDLLERLRSRLWERWPLRLHIRLAIATADHGQEHDELLNWLATALEAQARRGSVRRDLSGRSLAHVVLALFIGDAAQRFMKREATLASDPAFIDGVVRLLSAD
jgi:AcrR family transcriptional regulator